MLTRSAADALAQVVSYIEEMNLDQLPTLDFMVVILRTQPTVPPILLSARVFSPPHWQGKGKGPRQNNTLDS